ncbi:hypothetical protein EJ06DRAFT_497344 [Trichodelitschia bisporula]|uniref:Autophagy-related protein 17 n=1 Tax=Trichodelitschia bisporula TaxID=703511 RepID=A0A6G1HQ21_9PEZI|nr:hypothetical protein EJ06DRAFT_497344 [Trichodelitschia bisporula]
MAPPSAPASPASSAGSLNDGPPSLDQLVEYYLVSKRSLSSISHVWHAREIVESARAALEENAVLAAKITFLRHALGRQVAKLEGIRHGLALVDGEGAEGFKTMVDALDAASTRLNSTLDVLRETAVEPALRPWTEPPKHLFDFVDESGVHELYASIKASMDRFDGARSALTVTAQAFDDDLERVQVVLRGAVRDKGEVYTEGSVVPALFYALETHATETASHLEGLVKHYDLCVSALKHTEGGGDAMTRASADDQQASALAGLGVDLRVDDTVPPSISDEERAGMLAVLVKDAAEVDDVVAEIRDRLAEMEEQLAQIRAFIDGLHDRNGELQTALRLVKQVATATPAYIAACLDFQGAWEEEKGVLRAKMDEVEGLREFYSGFAGAYDGLLVEAHRRLLVKREMEKVVHAASVQIERLYQADLKEREKFRAAQAEYIPSDLWPGLTRPPPAYTVALEEGDCPEIGAAALEGAVKRLGGVKRGER